VLWTARVAWIVLPFTTGAAVAEIIQPWSRGPEIVAAVLLWAAWFAGFVALLAPRPWGFTILRVVAPCALILAIVSAWYAPWPLTVLAILTSGVALVTSLSSATAHACAASTAYGSERRFPLRVPVSLLAGPVPLSAVLVAAGVATGPLLLVGVPLAGALVRSLTALDHRWIVLVPAGMVVVDPLTFPDPVLLPREHIASVRRAPRSARVRVVDRDPSEILVGGTGPLLVTCRETGTFLRRAGRGHVNLEADRLRVSPLRPDAVLLAVDAHRITIA
jgi:hypothetical protein